MFYGFSYQHYRDCQIYIVLNFHWHDLKLLYNLIWLWHCNVLIPGHIVITVFLLWCSLQHCQCYLVQYNCFRLFSFKKMSLITVLRVCSLLCNNVYDIFTSLRLIYLSGLILQLLKCFAQSLFHFWPWFHIYLSVIYDSRLIFTSHDLFFLYCFFGQ